METWKALLGLTGILVVFTAVAEVTNTSLSSPGGVVILAATLLVTSLFYVTSKWGYRVGQDIGERMREEE